MTTLTEECQLIYYNYKKLEKAEIQRGENIERVIHVHLFSVFTRDDFTDLKLTLKTRTLAQLTEFGVRIMKNTA